MDADLDPVASLKDEHETVRRVLKDLYALLKELGSASPESRKNDLLARLDDITVFMDKDLEIHFKEEEDALFPVLGKYIGLETGPIHVMFIEHEHCRGLSAGFKAVIDDFRNAVDYDCRTIISAGNSFGALLSEHIDKEDHILFNMADMQLSPGEKQNISAKMETIKQ